MAMEAYEFSATSLIPWGQGAGLWYPSFLVGFLAPKPLAGIAEQMLGSHARDDHGQRGVAREGFGHGIGGLAHRDWDRPCNVRFDHAELESKERHDRPDHGRGFPRPARHRHLCRSGDRQSIHSREHASVFLGRSEWQGSWNRYRHGTLGTVQAIEPRAACPVV